MRKLVFYHGTNKKVYEKIKKEKVLWGTKEYYNSDGSSYNRYRYTYLTPHIDVAKKYGNLILEVKYKPVGNPKDNYVPNDWQFSVFEPIPLKDITLIINEEKFE